MLTDPDPFTAMVLQAVVVRACQIQEMRDQNLALRIANGVAKALS